MITLPRSLGSVLSEDDSLYRVVQGLLAFSGAAGRRDVLLRRTLERWEVIGRRAGLVEHPPAALGLTADLPHREHLARLRHRPLGVEAVPDDRRPVLQDAFVVDVSDLPILEGPTARLAAALDARAEVRRVPWWTRRSHTDALDRPVSLALADLWEAAAIVSLRSAG